MELPGGDLVMYDDAKAYPQSTEHYRLGKNGLEVLSGKLELIMLNERDGTYILSNAGVMANFTGRLRPFVSVSRVSESTIVVDGIRKGTFYYSHEESPFQLMMPGLLRGIPSQYLPASSKDSDAQDVYAGYSDNLEMFQGAYKEPDSNSGILASFSAYYWYLGNGIFFHYREGKTATAANFYVRDGGSMIRWSSYQSQLSAWTLPTCISLACASPVPQLDHCSKENSRKQKADEVCCCRENNPRKQKDAFEEDCSGTDRRHAGNCGRRLCYKNCCGSDCHRTGCCCNKVQHDQDGDCSGCKGCVAVTTQIVCAVKTQAECNTGIVVVINLPQYPIAGVQGLSHAQNNQLNPGDINGASNCFTRPCLSEEKAGEQRNGNVYRTNSHRKGIRSSNHVALIGLNSALLAVVLIVFWQ